MQLRLNRTGPKMVSLRRQFRTLRWLIPLTLMLLVIAYELGPARWIFETLGFTYHLLAEILIFATVGPALVFIMLDLLVRWLDERDTADYQASLLSLANKNEQSSRQLHDDMLQTLFATSLLIAELKSDKTSMSPELVEQIEANDRALDEAKQRLQTQLQDS